MNVLKKEARDSKICRIVLSIKKVCVILRRELTIGIFTN